MFEEKSNPKFSQNDYRILFKDRWDSTGMDETILGIVKEGVFEEYDNLKKNVPKRMNNIFNQKREGIITSKDSKEKTDRIIEEHLALALWNKCKSLTWYTPKTNEYHLIYYQFPLQRNRKHNGIGKVDFLGLTKVGQLTVIELKFKKEGKEVKINPIGSLLQGLRYSAIIEANLDLFRIEAKKIGIDDILKKPPIVQLMANKAWWDHWLIKKNPARGKWKFPFSRLLHKIESELNIVVDCVALDLSSDDILGVNEGKPIINNIPNLYPVCFEENDPYGKPSRPN